MAQIDTKIQHKKDAKDSFYFLAILLIGVCINLVHIILIAENKSQRPLWVYIVAMIIGLILLIIRKKLSRIIEFGYAMYSCLILVLGILYDSSHIHAKNEAENFYIGSIYGAGFVIACYQIKEKLSLVILLHMTAFLSRFIMIGYLDIPHFYAILGVELLATLSYSREKWVDSIKNLFQKNSQNKKNIVALEDYPSPFQSNRQSFLEQDELRDYRRLIDTNISKGVVILDKKLNVMFYNSSFYDIISNYLDPGNTTRRKDNNFSPPGSPENSFKGNISIDRELDILSFVEFLRQFKVPAHTIKNLYLNSPTISPTKYHTLRSLKSLRALDSYLEEFKKSPLDSQLNQIFVINNDMNSNNNTNSAQATTQRYFNSNSNNNNNNNQNYHESSYEIKIKWLQWHSQDSIILTFEDVTEREYMLQTQISDKSKDIIISSISHELKTPVNGILGTLQIIASKFMNEVLQQYVEKCTNCCMLQLSMLDSILDLQRIRSKRIKFKFTRVYLQKFLSNIQAMFQHFCDEKNIYFELDLSPDLPGYINTDESRLKIIFVNMVNNAVKFTTKGGITISAKPVDSSIEFTIKDTGAGIPEEDRSSLFMMYGRIENQTSQQKKTKGSGMGLFISQHLVKNIGNGEGIKFDTEVGKGTSFVFNIVNQDPNQAPRTISNHLIKTGTQNFDMDAPEMTNSEFDGNMASLRTMNSDIVGISADEYVYESQTERGIQYKSYEPPHESKNFKITTDPDPKSPKEYEQLLNKNRFQPKYQFPQPQAEETNRRAPSYPSITVQNSMEYLGSQSNIMTHNSRSSIMSRRPSDGMSIMGQSLQAKKRASNFAHHDEAQIFSAVLKQTKNDLKEDNDEVEGIEYENNNDQENQEKNILKDEIIVHKEEMFQILEVRSSVHLDEPMKKPMIPMGNVSAGDIDNHGGFLKSPEQMRNEQYLRDKLRSKSHLSETTPINKQHLLSPTPKGSPANKGFSANKIKKEANSIGSSMPFVESYSFLNKVNTVTNLLESQKLKKQQSMVPCVLIVDDNPFNLMVAQELVEAAGLNVHRANDGNEAIKCVLDFASKGSAYDLILMDIQMPNKDGFDAAKEINQYIAEGKVGDTPIVALSANDSEEDKNRTLLVGMKEHMAKPLIQEKLNILLNTYISKEKMNLIREINEHSRVTESRIESIQCQQENK